MRSKKGFILLAAGLIFITGLLLWKLFYTPIHYKNYPNFGVNIPKGYDIHGIDVSKYQKRINWSMVKDMKDEDIRLTFVFIKATQGVDGVDPQFKRNWHESAKMKMKRGAYHYFVANQDGEQQAKQFLKQVKFQTGDLPPVLDIEDLNFETDQELRIQVRAWLLVVERRLNVKPIIYSNAKYYEAHLEGYFGEYPFWVAHYYQKQKPRTTQKWTFWQHNDRGKVNGINALVDLNIYNGDSLSFEKLLIP